MVERYGERVAQGIIRDGQMIEDGLKRVKTHKELIGLGQTLSQLDPSTPDYPQKLIAIAPQFPEALRDPRGQAMMGMGAKQHFQWQQTQAANSRMQTQFGNQLALKGVRSADSLAADARAGNQGVDLSGIQLPPTLTPQNPAQGVQPIGPMQSGAPMGSQMTNGDGNEELMGMSGGLSENAAAQPVASDPLLARSRISPGLRALQTAKELENETKGTMKFKSGDVLKLAGSEAARDREAERQASIAKRTEGLEQISKLRIKAQETAHDLARKDRLTRLDFDKAKLAITDLEKFREDMMRARENSTKAGNSEEAMAQWDKAQELNGQIEVLKGKLLNTPEDDSSPKGDNPYVKGKKYQGMEYLGGDPKDPTNWRK